MFDLHKRERFIVIFLVVSLAIGIWAVAHKNTRAGLDISLDSRARIVPSARVAPQKAEATTTININTASKEELESLEGIGPQLAARVVEYRQAHGVFIQKEDIRKVTGIGERIYGLIKDKIRAE